MVRNNVYVYKMECIIRKFEKLQNEHIENSLLLKMFEKLEKLKEEC